MIGSRTTNPSRSHQPFFLSKTHPPLSVLKQKQQQQQSSLQSAKEQRAIKNRISALQSRRRQREHLESMETDLSSYKSRIFLLEEENILLKKELAELKNCNLLKSLNKENAPQEYSPQLPQQQEEEEEEEEEDEERKKEITVSTTPCHFATSRIARKDHSPQ